MKLISRSLLIPVVSLILFACGSNDPEPEKVIDNHIIIEGKKYAINDLVILKGTQQDLRYKDGIEKNTHYGYGVQLSDGNIISGPAATGAKYLVSIQFYAPITGNSSGAIPSGEWHAWPPQEFFGGNVPDDRFFSIFFIRIDENGNSLFGITENDTFMDASIGTITVSNDGDRYTFAFANTLNDPDPATPVTGSFEGDVRYGN